MTLNEANALVERCMKNPAYIQLGIRLGKMELSDIDALNDRVQDILFNEELSESIKKFKDKIVSTISHD